MSDEEEQDRPTVSADPLHSTDGFASRHLLRGLMLVVGLAVIVAAHTFVDCAGW